MIFKSWSLYKYPGPFIEHCLKFKIQTISYADIIDNINNISNMSALCTGEEISDVSLLFGTLQKFSQYVTSQKISLAF